ncbi:MAG: M23 family metallopeptidase [Clostridia bacterium]|nr:M23 family metallopeptidase [Clostridia bacterium]
MIAIIILFIGTCIGINLYKNFKIKEKLRIEEIQKIQEIENNNEIQEAEQEEEKVEQKEYIKWVDFNVPLELLEKTASLDIKSHNNEEKVKLDWIELLSYLGAKYGGNFKSFKQVDLDNLVQKLKNGESIENIVSNKKLYSYYIEAYTAILDEFIGEYEIEVDNNGQNVFQKKYGIKAFLPIAKNYNFSHYDDFGNSRSYGYKRVHLGNDLMGSIGTPIIAVESGTVEACGWNQYGGWRIGIRSFDKKRYYYYAHLRKDHPYAKDIKEGSIVNAGDVIGYLGMTGYSAKENVNNINVPHLHFGMQLIFDESQKDGTNQIWIDVYSIINFLKKNKSEVYMEYEDTKDYQRKYNIIDPVTEE